MTKEEAILCLKGIKNYGRDTFTEQSDWQESLDMAVEAIEQENCVGCTLEKLRADVTELLKEPATYVPNYDAYRRVIKIIDKYREEIEK